MRGQSDGSGRGAFTLLEVLVAAAVFIILMGILLGVLSNTTNITGTASRQLDANRIARESLDLIGRDLMMASQSWNRARTNSLQFLVNPTNLPAGFANRDAFFWQSPISRDATKGNLAIVGYLVLRDIQADPRNSRFQLRRVFIEPKDGETNYRIYSSPNDWLQASTYEKFSPLDSATDDQNAQQGWVADGVLGMWVQCLDSTGAPISGGERYDSRSAKYGLTTNGVNAFTNAYPAGYAYSRIPAFVQVTLVCAAPRDIPRLGELPSATNAAAFEDGVRSNSPGVKSLSSFTRQFRIYGGE